MAIAATDSISSSSCKVNINVSHGGVSDVRKHLATAKHQQLVKAEGKTKFKSMPHFS